MDYGDKVFKISKAEGPVFRHSVKIISALNGSLISLSLGADHYVLVICLLYILNKRYPIKYLFIIQL